MKTAKLTQDEIVTPAFLGELSCLASKIDRGEIDPDAGIDLVKRQGLLGYVVPERLGGHGATFSQVLDLCRALGSVNLGTSVAWAMHCHQIYVLLEYASRDFAESLLKKVVSEGLFLSSVTTEPEKQKRILATATPLTRNLDALHLDREAPVVSGGNIAAGFFITMRRDVGESSDAVVLVYVPREPGNVIFRYYNRMLGMRSSGNAALHIESDILPNQVIDPPGGFRRIATELLEPLGYLSLASCWLGSAEGALRAFLEVLHTSAGRVAMGDVNDLFAERLARSCLCIDICKGLIGNALAQYLSFRAEKDRWKAPPQEFHRTMMNLKVGVAENSLRAVEFLMDLSGFRLGYQESEQLPLERILRDIRSASLIYGNDRLLVSAGKLSMLQKESRQENDRLSAISTS